jgi:hypothetical protein
MSSPKNILRKDVELMEYSNVSGLTLWYGRTGMASGWFMGEGEEERVEEIYLYLVQVKI